MKPGAFISAAPIWSRYWFENAGEQDAESSMSVELVIKKPNAGIRKGYWESCSRWEEFE